MLLRQTTYIRFSVCFRHARYSDGKLLSNNGILVDDDGFESLSGNGSSGENGEDLIFSGKKTKPEECGEEIEDTNVDTGNCNKLVDKKYKPARDKTVTSNERCTAWVKRLQEKECFKLNKQQSAPDLFHDSSESESEDGSVRHSEKRIQKMV